MDRDTEFEKIVSGDRFFKKLDEDSKDLAQNELSAEKKLQMMLSVFHSSEDENAKIEMIRKYSLMLAEPDLSPTKRTAIEKFLPLAKEELPGWPKGGYVDGDYL